jgi:hypothetical protein
MGRERIKFLPTNRRSGGAVVTEPIGSSPMPVPEGPLQLVRGDQVARAIPPPERESQSRPDAPAGPPASRVVRRAAAAPKGAELGHTETERGREVGPFRDVHGETVQRPDVSALDVASDNSGERPVRRAAPPPKAASRVRSQTAERGRTIPGSSSALRDAHVQAGVRVATPDKAARDGDIPEDASASVAAYEGANGRQDAGWESMGSKHRGAIRAEDSSQSNKKAESDNQTSKRWGRFTIPSVWEVLMQLMKSQPKSKAEQLPITIGPC